MNHLTPCCWALHRLLLGDPRWLYHPVQAIGWLIVKLEPPLRRAFPDSDRGQVRAGVALVILVVGITAWSAAAFSGGFTASIPWRALRAR